MCAACSMSRAGTPVVASPQAGVQSGEQRGEFVPAHRMRRHEVIVDQVIAPEDVQEGKGQGGVAAGKGLQVQISSLRRGGAYRIDHNDLPGRLASQCSWACGPEAEGLAPHTTMQAASRAVRGSKPSRAVP